MISPYLWGVKLLIYYFLFNESGLLLVEKMTFMIYSHLV